MKNCDKTPDRVARSDGETHLRWPREPCLSAVMTRSRHPGVLVVTSASPPRVIMKPVVRRRTGRRPLGVSIAPNGRGARASRRNPPGSALRTIAMTEHRLVAGAVNAEESRCPSAITGARCAPGQTTSHGTTLLIPMTRVNASFGPRVAAHLRFAKTALVVTRVLAALAASGPRRGSLGGLAPAAATRTTRSRLVLAIVSADSALAPAPRVGRRTPRRLGARPRSSR